MIAKIGGTCDRPLRIRMSATTVCIKTALLTRVMCSQAQIICIHIAKLLRVGQAPRASNTANHPWRRLRSESVSLAAGRLLLSRAEKRERAINFPPFMCTAVPSRGAVDDTASFPYGIIARANSHGTSITVRSLCSRRWRCWNKVH